MIENFYLVSYCKLAKWKLLIAYKVLDKCRVSLGGVVSNVTDCDIVVSDECISFVESIMFGLVCLVLWHINLCRLFNAKSIFI